MFTIPNNALQNVMTCRVFRQLRLGIIPTTEPTRSAAEIALSWRPSNTTNSFQNPNIETPHVVQKYGAHLDPYVGGTTMHIQVTRDIEVNSSDGADVSKYGPHGLS